MRTARARLKQQMKHERKHQRGTSLIEGMAAAAILVVGILGALQALLFATKQNADADRRTRATSVALHLRTALETYGFTRLTTNDGPLDIDCTGDADALQRVAHLPQTSDLTNTSVCVLDLDAFEATHAGTNRMLMPGYRQSDRDVFRRLAVLYVDTTGTDELKAWREVAVIVSWRGGLGNFANVTHMLGLYDPAPQTGNETHVEI